MYTIYADGEALYSPHLVNDGYGVLSPKLTVELNKSGSLSFILPPSNVMYDSIQKLKTIVTVMQDNEELFRGRVLHDEKDFYNRKNVYCEGELSFLLDSIQRPYTFQGDIPVLFRKFISNHNEQVETEKQFTVGNITVTDPNNYINRENSGYNNTLDEIKSKLINIHGGYIRPRLQNGIRYIDLVEEYGKISSQVIEFGVNMLDITEYITAEDVFTVLIPLGAEQKDAEGNTTGRLTIESVNGGKDYIEDTEAIALFGRIWKVQQWDDVTIANNLLTKGKETLKAGIEMAVSLTMKAVDMHLLDVDTERIKLGDHIRVVSPPHKLDKYFLCSKIVIDMANPDKTEFTLGVTFTAMTDKQANSAKIVQNTVSVVQSSAASAQNSANQANNAANQVEQIINNMSDYVKTSTFEAYKQEVSNKISSVYRFKGSVASYNSLPVYDREVGDVWNALDTGANYAWTTDGWDKLSETYDLSAYALKDDVPEKMSDLENDSGFITEEQAETDYVKTNTFETYKQEVNSKISSVYRFKGSVENYNSLPVNDQEIGDVWNTSDTGANYAWTSEGWDKLSENFDLSEYALKEDVPEKMSDLENDSGFITEEQAETDYVKTSAFEALVQRVEVLEGSGI